MEAFSVVFAGGILAAYGKAVRADIREWRRFRDRRATRGLVVGVALFLAAFFSAIAIVLILTTRHNPDDAWATARQIALGASWATFAGAGLARATAPRSNS